MDRYDGFHEFVRARQQSTERETAHLLGCSLGTVKSQTHHALGRLRTLAPELAHLLTEHVPQALGMFGEQAHVPLAITGDGRMMAYHSRQEQTFKVRELDGGKELTAPITVTEQQLGPHASLIPSDDGRHLAFTGGGSP
ncbi:hypothetical protein ACQPYK_22295 [Streptosporangium sp. CA-135522]|uniref:hypothetical protein n=1 Tax=Streptosporangium sp. CA-135522 TaxID=3240072 RepID=UPI003D8B1224